MNKITVLSIFLVSILSCSSEQKADNEIIRLNHNFELVAYDSEINDPKKDRKSFYIVYIDKTEAGRTSTGLESQEKYFEAMLTDNKHLVTLEKWVLDETKGRYVKLNNIEQPKPDFIYIIIEKEKLLRVTMKAGTNGTATYSSEIK